MKIRSAVLLAMIWVALASAQNYTIDWYVIASGGGHAVSENYQVDGTIGQPLAGQASSENYSVESGFWVGAGSGSGSPCGLYVVGDFNGSDVFNIADIVSAFSKLKTGAPDPLLLCECPPGGGVIWAVAMDVNNSCGFNVADIVAAFSRLKTGSPELIPCELCPPGLPIPPYPEDGDRLQVMPVLESRSPHSVGAGAE